ncbi:MAG: hypothetical protein Q7S76_01675 [bacterium]|nr:hypothetical protein [bacterium]
MEKKKKRVRNKGLDTLRSATRSNAVEMEHSDDFHSHESSISPVRSKRSFIGPVFLVVFFFVLVLLLRKGYVISAIVNGRPIFWWQVNHALTSRFGTQTMERMVSEALIEGEAKNRNIVVTQAEISSKQDDILKSFGGQVSIDELLQYQGISRQEFERDLYLQLIVQKILQSEVSVTEEDVSAYIASNSAALSATEPSSLREEARQGLINQKISERIQPWFAELKEKAQIVRLFEP